MAESKLSSTRCAWEVLIRSFVFGWDREITRLALALVSNDRKSRRPLADILGQEEVPTVALDGMDEVRWDETVCTNTRMK